MSDDRRLEIRNLSYEEFDKYKNGDMSVLNIPDGEAFEFNGWQVMVRHESFVRVAEGCIIPVGP